MEPIFSNRFGNLFTPHVINLAIERIRNEHNAREQITALKEKREPVIIPHFSCHHLRHTFCSRLSCKKHSSYACDRIFYSLIFCCNSSGCEIFGCPFHVFTFKTIRKFGIVHNYIFHQQLIGNCNSHSTLTTIAVFALKYPP